MSGDTDAPLRGELSSEELDQIEARCAAAVSGPWKSFIEGRDHTSGSSFIMTGSPDQRGPDIELSGATSQDQDFIAHAREDVPRLLAEIRRLRQLLSEKGRWSDQRVRR
jgi:hypothetical protein